MSVRLFKSNRRIIAKTSPLLHIPYKIQLKMKETRAKSALTYFSYLMTKHSNKKQCDEFYSLYERSKPLPCPLDPIRSPGIIDGYRNKNTFSLDVDADRNLVAGHSRTISIRKYAHSRSVCAPIKELPSVKPSHWKLADLFLEFLKTSKYPHFSPLNQPTGNWCDLVVRSNIKDEVMFYTHFNPHDLHETDVKIAETELLEKFLPLCKSDPSLNVKSLYFLLAPFRQMHRMYFPQKLIWGDPYIIEECNGKKFQISPNSFFQVNTHAAELLYKATEELIETSKKSLLLDLCCGTGTIGIILADKVNHVIGVDIVPAAIEDAKKNAILNGTQNIEHHCGDVCQLFDQLSEEGRFSQYDHVVAVINPHRDGLKNHIMRHIRKCKNIQQVVYLSCRPEGQPTNNFYALCKASKSYSLDPPFVMNRVIPIDPFPNTKYVELVLNFVRAESVY